MKLVSFSVENYRAFSRRQNIEIRPLTLFFGWNSGGKSALVRFLPLLAESFGKSLPIWLAGKVGRRATWSELVCKSTGHGRLRFALSWEGTPPLATEWEILGGDRSQEMILSPDPGQWAADDPLSILSDCVQWISGIRVPPPRIVLSDGGVGSHIQPDGSDVVDHLVEGQLQSTKNPLLEHTQRFFHVLGVDLSLDNPVEGGWRLLLSPCGLSKLAINLCDVGEGYAQVLPILVALAHACRGGPRLLCLEHPELHLHTRAQVELARVLVESAQDPAKPSILLETHSEILLTSVQLAIAEGRISPGMVRVYWVEAREDGTSDARPVDFNDKGQPTNTALTGAFREVVRLARELSALQIRGHL